MGVLTHIVAAEEDEAEAIGEAPNPLDLWSGIGCNELTIARIAMLHSVVTGESFDEAAASCELVFVSPSEGAGGNAE